MNKPITNDPVLGRTSQGRRDALSGRWVIFAPGRSERPAELTDTVLPTPTGHACPFCAGNESHTPPATFAIQESREKAGQWTVRVVPNLFPAVTSFDGETSLGYDRRRFPISAEWQDTDHLPGRRHQKPGVRKHFGAASFRHLISDGDEVSEIGEEEPLAPESIQRTDRPRETLASDNVDANRTASHGKWNESSPDNQHQDKRQNPSLDETLFEFCDLHGGHEVIIESPAHVESLTSLSKSHAAKVFETYAERIRYWSTQPGIRYVVVFKNVGAAAGASLRHTHSQLIATSLLPPALHEIGQRMQDHHARVGGCLVCDMLAGELADGRRIVATTKRFVAYCPFASRLPYLVRIAPLSHADRFETNCNETLKELAVLTQQVLRSLESMFVTCAYNYTIHTRPPSVASKQSYHWWMEIFPRLTKVAGFEWGSDCYINPVTPEVAAEHLRDDVP
jgi:UDPglucose--hexose-1-phosphate uridylyltransferase